MHVLVTSASGHHGTGSGKLLAFDEQGKLIGPFSKDLLIVDPRGLGVEPSEDLVFLNSGSDRILALDRTGKVVRGSDRPPGLDPGGGNLGPDGQYYVGLRSDRTIMAFPKISTSPVHLFFRQVPFPTGFGFGQVSLSILERANAWVQSSCYRI
jgi:hypothetical protein